jgi:hypothetical protein
LVGEVFTLPTGFKEGCVKMVVSSASAQWTGIIPINTKGDINIYTDDVGTIKVFYHDQLLPSLLGNISTSVFALSWLKSNWVTFFIILLFIVTLWYLKTKLKK